MKILLCISFLGTRYCGWQVQKNGVSVQQVVQKAVGEVLGAEYPLTGCSRTDAGVHAERFYCTVGTGEDSPRVPVASLPSALNLALPDDISVLTARIVPDAFHPRYDVLEKEYLYRIWNMPQRDPFLTGRAYHLPKKLDVGLMNEACAPFLGKHDFSACMAKGSSVEERTRNVMSFSVSPGYPDGMVEVRVSSDGFLYHMVRIMVGTLIEVSRKRIDVLSLPERILSLDRSRMGFTAPACGLYLNRVVYRENN